MTRTAITTDLLYDGVYIGQGVTSNSAGYGFGYIDFSLPTGATAGVVYACSFWYKSTGRTASVWCHDTTGLNTAYSATLAADGTWRRGISLFTSTTSGKVRLHFHTDAGSSGDVVYFTAPMIEQQTFGTPFVNGTRSSSQALIDLTGRYTLTAANVTYSSNTFSFNGSNSCFDLNTTSLISGTQDFTIEAVYYTSATDTAGREIIGNYGTGATSNTLWFATHGLWINGATPYHAGSPLRNGTYYTAATRLGSATSLYKNGALELTGTNSTSIAVGQNWRIGKDVGGDGEPFLGNIYMIRVYNRALNAGEIYQNYNAVRTRYGI
jgi:hypothetical protein